MLLGLVLLLAAGCVVLRCSRYAASGPAPPGTAFVQPRAGSWPRARSGSHGGARRLAAPSVPEADEGALDAELIVRSPIGGDGTWTPPTPAELAQVDREASDVPVVDGWDVLTPTDSRLDAPLLMQGLTDAWPAMKWSRDDMLERVGQTPLRVRPCSSLHEFGFPGPGIRRASLREYFETEGSYGEIIFENDFQPVHQELREGYTIPNLLSGIHSNPVFSCGRANTGIGFHRHNEAWLAQLHGRKAWFLLPPQAPRPAVVPPWWYLQSRPDGLQVVVPKPGEVIYVPANWWHATWNLDDFTVALGWEGGASRCWEADAHAIADGDLSRVDAADVPAPNVTALAARAGHADILRLLIEEDADLALRANAVPVAQAAARGGHVAVLELLQGYRTLLSPAADGRGALHAAAQYGQPEAASWLLERGAEPRQRDAEGLEPLHLAASYGHKDVVAVLLEAGADVHSEHGESSTALLGAAFNGHQPVLEELLDAGADPEAQDALQMTALHLAALRGHALVADELLSRRAWVGTRDHLMRTPLHLAAHGYEDADDRSGGIRTAPDANLAVVETLLGASAELRTLDLRGKQPKDYARERGHFGVAQYLEAFTPSSTSQPPRAPRSAVPQPPTAPSAPSIPPAFDWALASLEDPDDGS